MNSSRDFEYIVDTSEVIHLTTAFFQPGATAMIPRIKGMESTILATWPRGGRMCTEIPTIWHHVSENFL